MKYRKLLNDDYLRTLVQHVLLNAMLINEIIKQREFLGERQNENYKRLIKELFEVSKSNVELFGPSFGVHMSLEEAKPMMKAYYEMMAGETFIEAEFSREGLEAMKADALMVSAATGYASHFKIKKNDENKELLEQVLKVTFKVVENLNKELFKIMTLPPFCIEEVLKELVCIDTFIRDFDMADLTKHLHPTAFKVNLHRVLESLTS